MLTENGQKLKAATFHCERVKKKLSQFGGNSHNVRLKITKFQKEAQSH
jgi:hypothetical protein